MKRLPSMDTSQLQSLVLNVKTSNVIDDPDTRRKAHVRRMALMGPRWSPCPPTASESFLHEIPVHGKMAVPEKVLANEDGLETPVCDKKVSVKKKKVSVDDLINDYEVYDRDGRRNEAEMFRRFYSYGFNDTMEQKTCISSSGIYTWPEKSSGVIWVAVHGINSICVVTRNAALDMKRLGNYLKAVKQHVCHLFRETLISEMEDLADPSSEARQKIHQSFDKPFAVVSLPSGTSKANEENSPEASGAVYDDKRAINFLEEKMKSGSTLTYGYSETLQMAISAFLLLFDQELKAKDIMVCVWAKRHGAKNVWIRDAGEDLVVLYQKGIETLVERLPK